MTNQVTNLPVLSRLLLWDCDERSYSYFIEVSTNQQQWTKVVDRTKVACRSVSCLVCFFLSSTFYLLPPFPYSIHQFFFFFSHDSLQVVADPEV